MTLRAFPIEAVYIPLNDTIPNKCKPSSLIANIQKCGVEYFQKSHIKISSMKTGKINCVPGK